MLPAAVVASARVTIGAQARGVLLKDARADIEQNMKSTLQAGLSKLDLVTREEFEVQRAVLLRTREKIDALERTVQILEARLASPDDSASH